MSSAAFPGSFDPPTLGHIDIIGRAARIFDRLTVLLAENKDKFCLFTVEKRLEMLRLVTKKHKNVTVDMCPADTLLVDFLRERGINVMVRGIRGGGDFENESALAAVNRMLDETIETVFVPCRPEFSAVSSSAVRTLALFNRDLSAFVPGEIEAGLHKGRR